MSAPKRAKNARASAAAGNARVLTPKASSVRSTTFGNQQSRSPQAAPVMMGLLIAATRLVRMMEGKNDAAAAAAENEPEVEAEVEVATDRDLFLDAATVAELPFPEHKRGAEADANFGRQQALDAQVLRQQDLVHGPGGLLAQRGAVAAEDEGVHLGSGGPCLWSPAQRALP